jgi:hypothetical protein
VKNDQKKIENKDDVFYLHVILHTLLLIIKKLSTFVIMKDNNSNSNTSSESHTLNLKLKLQLQFRLQLLVLPYTENLQLNVHVENKLWNQKQTDPRSSKFSNENVKNSEQEISKIIWNQIQDLLKFSSYEITNDNNDNDNNGSNEIKNLEYCIAVLTATHTAFYTLLHILTISMKKDQNTQKEVPIRKTINQLQLQANTPTLQNSIPSPKGIIPDKTDKTGTLRLPGREKEREEIWVSLLAVCGALQSMPCTAAFLTYSLNSSCTNIMSSSLSSPTYPSSSSSLTLSSSSSSSSSSSLLSLPPSQVLDSNTNNNINTSNTNCIRYDLFTERYVTAYSQYYISFMLQVVHSRVSVLQHQGLVFPSFKTSDRNESTGGGGDGGGDITGEGDRILERQEEKEKEKAGEKNIEKERERDVRNEEERVMEKEREKEKEMVMLQCADELWAAVLHVLNAATPSPAPAPSSFSSSSTSPSPPPSSTSSTTSSIHLHTAAYFFAHIIISWNTFNIPIKIFETRTLDLISGISKNPQSHGMFLLSALRVLILKWKKSPPIHCVCSHVSCHTVTDKPHMHGSAVVNTTGGVKGSGHTGPLGAHARAGGEEGVRGRTGGEGECPFCQGHAVSVGTGVGTGTDREWLKDVHSVKYSNSFLVTII